jgi:hypothetical protein
MKPKKSVFKTILVFIIITINYQCASSKIETIEQQLTIPQAYFSEWYAGIEVGGTGFNIYFPNLGSKQPIEIDSVYFRNLKGKLVKGRAVYSAILKHPTKNYENINKTYSYNSKERKTHKIWDNLKPNECVIKYIENDVVKYQKINNVVERIGIYYKDGPPELIVNHNIKSLTQSKGVVELENDN